MRGYVASDLVVWIFCTLEETGKVFMNYELADVVSDKADLDHWLKRTHGTRSLSLETYLFGEFVSIGFCKL
jgi:hypothetical protein